MLRRLGWLVAAGTLVALLAPPLRGQQVPERPAGSVVVGVTQADGRRQPIVVGPTSGGMWTPVFVRVPNATTPTNQPPVSAINFVCSRDPDGVRVAVSVFRRDTLDNLTAFENSPSGAGNLQAWLNTTSDRYVRRYTRLGGR